MGEGMDRRDYNELEQAVSLAYHTVYRKYLSELNQYAVVKPDDILMDEKAENCIRMFQLDEMTYKNGEDVIQKLSTVYHASMSLGCSMVVMLDVEKNDSPVKIYVGVRYHNRNDDDRDVLSISFNTLKRGMKSNFPGTCFHEVGSKEELPNIIDAVFGEQVKHIASVSCVASARDKSKTEHKDFIQGIERFIDVMQGRAYTAVLIAEPVLSEEQRSIRSGYENLYSSLSSFSKSVWSYHENSSEAVLKTLSKGISKSITESVSHTQGHTIQSGINLGLNGGRNMSTSEAHTKSHTESDPTSASRMGHVLSAAAPVAGMFIGAVTGLGPVGSKLIGTGLAGLGAALQGSSTSDGESDTTTNATGSSFGGSGGLNIGRGKISSDTTSHSDTETESSTETKGTTKTTGNGTALQIETVNKSIEGMLERLEELLKRAKEGEDYGACCCGAYFVSSKQDTVLLASNTYRALMMGEGTSVEGGAINIWSEANDEDAKKLSAIKEYLKRFAHPVFAAAVSGKGENASEFAYYTPGTIVSGLKLPIHLGVLARSVYGLPVLKHAEFGRNVTEKSVPLDDDRRIRIGRIYHMGHVEEKSFVDMNVSGLTAHTFITGSTGSGKSNTVYQMLKKLGDHKIPFLVVESAKGEYKKAFDTQKDVMVYGTNPNLSNMELLRINPFSFPSNIHVLEHLDRLIEIFNVCWPMYAAMPAILKDAVQRAYEEAGWDLIASTNRYDSRIYPTFTDVYHQIRLVLEESEYSQDNKSDYTGSLVTRLRSLTTGIYGLIFTADEVGDDQLFDKNVIVDLSRVGSSETKSLIMGLLVLKLQEYHMDVSEPNQKLKHVTVLEEAHNLLRRTSIAQVDEGSNLQGKAVEMLANAIAEMRTYGEGFIIADQSPGLLDMSVIRNTNNKIILRLPDASDRELVGRAVGLNEDQIVELEKLDGGVAAIKQSEWLEPVLCKVDKYTCEPGSTPSGTCQPEIRHKRMDADDVQQTVLEFLMKHEPGRHADRIDLQSLEEKIVKSNLDAAVKCRFLDFIQADESKEIEALQKLVYEFFHGERAIQGAEKYDDIETWTRSVVKKLDPSVENYREDQVEMLVAMLLLEKSSRDADYENVLARYTEIIQKRGGLR